MFGSWKIARVRGIDLFIHWTFWLLPIYIIFTYDDQALLPLWAHLVLIGCLFVCVVLHEFGHALTAQLFGIGTRSITLSPLGGIAQLERMSHKPWEEFWIAVAGPAVNVVIAALLGAFVFSTYVINPNVMDTMLWRFFAILVTMNVGLVLFNMIPAFPMDGGRVLRAILAGSMGLLKGTRVAVAIGTVMAILMGLAGVVLFSNPFLFLISLFVIFAGTQELQALEQEERRRKEAMRMTVALWDSRLGGWVRKDVVAPAHEDY